MPDTSQSATPVPARTCPRCGTRPCRPGLRLCAECHRAHKQARKATVSPAPGVSSTGGPRETPEKTETQEGASKAGETAVPRVVRRRIPLFGKRPRPGPQLPRDWEGRFLRFYAEHGVRWRAAKAAGVSHDAVTAAERADPTFARQVENAARNSPIRRS